LENGEKQKKKQNRKGGGKPSKTGRGIVGPNGPKKTKAHFSRSRGRAKGENY